MDQHPIKRPRSRGARYWAIIPAAGSGRRMGGRVAKQYLRIGGRTILELSVERLRRLPELTGILLVLQPGDDSWTFLRHGRFDGIHVVPGGEERCHSVWNGLRALAEWADDDDWVLVHDAVRPCVTEGDLRRLLDTLADDLVGGLLATPVRETVKRADDAMCVDETLDRSQLWLAATPQMFRYRLLREAMEAAMNRQMPVTDEAAAMEAMGHRVRLVPGRHDNIKITHPEDLSLAAHILAREEV